MYLAMVSNWDFFEKIPGLPSQKISSENLSALWRQKSNFINLLILKKTKDKSFDLKKIREKISFHKFVWQINSLKNLNSRSDFFVLNFATMVGFSMPVLLPLLRN